LFDSCVGSRNKPRFSCNGWNENYRYQNNGNGNIDVEVKEKAIQYKDELSCLMVTYPSTWCFESLEKSPKSSTTMAV
jgi:hypothetical protein